MTRLHLAPQLHGGAHVASDPYQDMIDTIGGDADGIISSSHLWLHAFKVLAYITGPSWLQWTPAQLSAVNRRGAKAILRTDQANQASNIFHQIAYLVIDIEPGAATVFDAIRIAQARAKLKLRTCLYTFAADFNVVRNEVEKAHLTGSVDYGIADWDLDRAEAIALLGGPIKFVQYASPTSNPYTFIPGTGFTLEEKNVDLSVALADWPTVSRPPPPIHSAPRPSDSQLYGEMAGPAKKLAGRIHPKTAAATLAGSLFTGLVAAARAKGVPLTPVESAGISTLAAAIAAWLKKA